VKNGRDSSIIKKGRTWRKKETPSKGCLDSAKKRDDNLHWIGGKTHFVQTGDIMDRGDRAKEILDLLMRLEKEAEAAGGKVHILLGNHEEATITGISLGCPDYVSAKQFVSFLPEDFRKA
jgi:hypothetical protein